MSAVTTEKRAEANPRTALRADLGPVSGIPLSRLVRVELRKMLDTTAGRWFIASIGLVILAFVLIQFIWGNDEFRSYENFFGAGIGPLAYLLPILGIMSVTAERSQRTAMTTYALEPRRGRVLLAKVIAAYLMGVVAFLLAAGLGAGAHLASITVHDTTAAWGIGWATVFGFALELLIRVGIGLAFGMLLLNTAGAIVAYLLVPIIWTMLNQMIPALQGAAEWLDFNLTTSPLYDTTGMTGEQWAQLGTSIGLWLVLPMILGIWRMLRSEVK